MLCDKCKERPACVHITKVVNNQKTEQHLCDACAESLKGLSLSMDNTVSVHDFLKGMFNYGFSPQLPDTVNVCPSCGMTYDDCNRTGKIGCSVCYKTFNNELMNLSKRIHGNSSHTGKVPKRSGGIAAIKQQLKTLRSKLEQCISSEDYEQAAVIRDEIRKIEREYSNSTND